MLEVDPANPAEVAAKAALDDLFATVDAGQCFVLEAGAGAGKTYSLTKALQKLLGEKGTEFIRRHQQIACITYTNVAKDEIEARTDRHPAIRSETIHGFCWSLLRDFQSRLRGLLPNLNKWPEAIETAGGLKGQRVEYDLGNRRIDDAVVSIRHDDVLALMVACLAEPKFRRLLACRFPVIFIDEYQDADARFVEALKRHFLDADEGPLLGFFGDAWQKIYGDGCGEIVHTRLRVIGKGANFRSVKAIVDPLNRMRPQLPQMVKDQAAQGEATVFHTNAWLGQRQSGNHWGGDVSLEAAHRYLDYTTAELQKAGWAFDPAQTKVLMLTHKILAKEQGYAGIAAAFAHTESYIKKEDPHIAYLVDVIEPACAAFLAKRYGAMFEALGTSRPPIARPADKVAWANAMTKLIELRTVGNMGQVFEHLRACGLLRLPEKVEDREKDFAKRREVQDDEPSWATSLRKLRPVPYQEVVALKQYINNYTPFATKHGVKGAEFENVLVVVGRGWNMYNFEQMLCWFENGVPKDKEETFVRNRNLFYVACSRPRRRLAVLFTQFLTPPALATLTKWFGTAAIRQLPHMEA